MCTTKLVYVEYSLDKMFISFFYIKFAPQLKVDDIFMGAIKHWKKLEFRKYFYDQFKTNWAVKNKFVGYFS